MARAILSARWGSAFRAALACLAVLLSLACATADPAGAQSSVRPPANAVTSATPRPDALRSTAPSRGVQPTDVTGGRVPGNALGSRSSAEMWQALRRGVTGTVSIPDRNAALLVQSQGETWRALRTGPIPLWSAIALGATFALLVVFFLVRGRIRIDSGLSGRTITRFNDLERMAHWLLAVSFLVLAITGLTITFGKTVLIPILGKEAFSIAAAWGKWLHNYVAFAFMAGLVLVFVIWVKDNLLSLYDFVWIAKGGGLLVKGVHPPAKKFNFGQKVIFWLVLLGGLSLSLSGLALLFPFSFSLFADTFALLNRIGFDLPTELAPVQEMQLATLWHAIVAYGLLCVIIAHIYIGTIGMEGAFSAMGSGEVDLNWAKEHHSLWVEEVQKAEPGAGESASRQAAPAE